MQHLNLAQKAYLVFGIILVVAAILSAFWWMPVAIAHGRHGTSAQDAITTKIPSVISIILYWIGFIKLFKRK